jgi:hypothetical protein
MDEPTALSGTKRPFELDESDQKVTTRQRSSFSELQIILQNVPNGVEFISLMNPRKRFFLPSSKNSFGGMKVRKVMCDSGCSSLLLPLENPDTMKDLFSKFEEGYKFSVSESANVGGHSVCLIIESLSPTDNFKVNLCEDLMGQSNILIKRLRFSLCCDDIDTITETYIERFGQLDRQRISSGTGPKKRRTHALLGQDIMFGFCLIKYRHVELYVNPKHYKFPKIFEELQDQTESIENQLRKFLPECFDDWVDDDFTFEDDEKLQKEEFEYVSSIEMD